MLLFLLLLWPSLLVLLFVQDVVPEDQMKEEIMDSIQKGNFTMRILKDQLQNILKMGPVGQVMGMIPGFNNAMMPKVPHAPSLLLIACCVLSSRMLASTPACWLLPLPLVYCLPECSHQCLLAAFCFYRCMVLWLWGADVGTGLGVHLLQSQLMHCVCHKMLALLASQSFQVHVPG